jgi:hypothetical protein
MGKMKRRRTRLREDKEASFFVMDLLSSLPIEMSEEGRRFDQRLTLVFSGIAPLPKRAKSHVSDGTGDAIFFIFFSGFC